MIDTGVRDPRGAWRRLPNLSMRSFTLAGKFLLVFFLTQFLKSAEMGLYGLLVVTTGNVLFVLLLPLVFA
ncbi:hypothetical protein DNJ95_14335 [Stutzerimonas kirkiae]|nr:hypothetical protein DNJ95_14335 [Stutzerimonas kirkiae]